MEVNFNGPIASSPTLKKRVLFIITQSETGGAQRFLTQLIAQIYKNYDICVATGRDGDGSILKELPPEITRSLIHALRRDISPLSDIRAVFEIKNLLRDFQPDTVFLLSSKAGFIGSLATYLYDQSTKVIYRIGGWSFNDPGPSWKRRLWIILEKISARWKDIIIVNNSHDLDQAKTLNIRPAESLLLIHNGIDPYKLELLPKDEAREELCRGTKIYSDFNKKKIVGTIANFYPPKGLEYLVEAASHINNSDLIFCVIGEGRERTKLENLINKYGLSDKFFLVGQRPKASRYLSAFDIFVLPSLKEGSPWVLLEAMAAKLPVIATRVGSVPEIIDDGINGYIVSPAKPEEISDRINSLIGNERVALEMGIQAHQKILFSFPLDTMIKQTEQLL